MRHGELVSIVGFSRGNPNFDLTTTKVAGSHTKQPSFNTLVRSPHTFCLPCIACVIFAWFKLLNLAFRCISSSMLAPVIYLLLEQCTVGKMPIFLEKDTLFRINAAKMHRSIAAKEVHIARYLFWGSGGKVCGYIVVLGRWWQATTAGDAVSLSASTNQPTHWKEQPLLRPS